MYDRSTTFPLICARIAEGESLRSVCRSEGMPAISNAMAWIAESPEFQEQYARAREARADYHFERGIEIVSEKPEYVDGDTNHKAGASRMDSACVAWQRIQFDAHKWAASKLNPRKYADKLDLNHGGQDGNPIQNTVRVLFGRD